MRMQMNIDKMGQDDHKHANFNLSAKW